MKSELNIIKKSALNLWAGRLLLPVILFLLLPCKALSQLVANFTVSSTVCSGSIVTITNTSTGTSGSTTFIWSFGAGANQATSTGAGPHLITYTGSGPATITLTLQDSPLTPSTKSTTITINALPGVSLAAAGPFCVNSSSVQLVGLPAGGTYSGAGVNSTGTFTPATAGSGSHTITYTFTDINSCTNSANTIIVVNPLPAAPVVTVVDNCNGTSTLSTAATGTLLWNTGASTASIIVSAAGTYTVTATVNGCTGPAGSGTAAPKTAPAAPVVTVVDNCNGTSTLSTVATGTLLWSTGAATSSINVITAGVNTVTTTVNGCTSPAGNGTAAPKTAPPAPVTIVTQPNCTLATGTITVTVQNASDTYSFDNGAFFQAGNIKAGLTPAPYNVIIKSSGGCSSVVTVAVVNPQPLPPAPIIGTITQPTCVLATGSVALSGLPTAVPAVTWIVTRNPGSKLIAWTGTTALDDLVPAGTYTYTVTNVTTGGCTSVSSASAVVNAQPAAPAAPLQTTDCTLGFNLAKVTVTSPLGTGIEYKLDAGAYQTTVTFAGVINGSHAITVRNAAGCTTTGTGFTVSCGCVNGPSIVLSSITGNTCGTAPVTIAGNEFGGNATSVSLTSNGTGTLAPATVTVSPFSFTYTPAAGDAGKTVIITATTNNPLGVPCAAAVAQFTLIVNPLPAAPTVGTITQPTCNISSGSVVLNGLPAAGTWTLTRSPGGLTTSGTGSTKTISGLDVGTYTFTVGSSTGCTSVASSDVLISAQPGIPVTPTVGTITGPTCNVSTGSVLLSGLPATGTWTLTRFPGTVTTTGAGISMTIPGLAPGTYNYTVTSSAGCVSPASSNVVIIAQPGSPATPIIGTITQPTCSVSTGIVVLSGLPATGTWTLTSTPDTITVSGTGTTTTVSGLQAGAYSFIVKSPTGCVSAGTGVVNIVLNPLTPALIVSNPAPVCFPSTADLTASSVTAGSSTGLTYTYWTNPIATVTYNSPTTANDGTYYIKGTVAQSGCSVIKPVSVIVKQKPVANAGPDIAVDVQFSTNMKAVAPGINETGLWTLLSGTGTFASASDPLTNVTNLSGGDNIFLWSVTNNVCLPSSDSVKVTVRNLVIPTLITPNMDGRNDYFVIRGKESLGKIELVIFDRNGHRVYKSNDYNNDWNGVDEKGNPLDDDTYFYILKTQTGMTYSKYIVIRR